MWIKNPLSEPPQHLLQNIKQKSLQDGKSDDLTLAKATQETSTII